MRFLNVRSQRDYNRLPILQYWLLHLVWLFPWSLGFPLLLKERFRFQLKRDTQTQINLYLLIWAGIVLIFFGLSSNQEYYTFPAYPALALLLGKAFADAQIKHQGFLLWMNRLLAAIALTISSIFGVIVWKTRTVKTTGDIANALNLVAADSENYTRFLGRFFDLTPQVFAELRDIVIISALGLSFGFLLALWFRQQKKHGQAVIAMLFTIWLIFICASRAHIAFEPVLSSRTLAHEITQRWKPGAKIVINGNHEIASSVGFYTNQQLLLLNGRKFNLEFGSRYQDAPPVFLTNEDLHHLWLGSKQVFLYTENIKKEQLLKNLNLPVTLIADYGDKSLLTNIN